MKKYVFLILIALFFCSCEKEEINSYPDIKLGNLDESLSEININKFTERKIILSGGNNKYSVNIENSKIAKATIYKDTLKIKALFEGRTFASVKSHNHEVKLGVNVIPQEIGISQKEIRLFPKDISKFISVNGGGDTVTMEEIDPDNILDVQWNGETGILKLKAYFEGETIIRFKSENVTTKELKIVVKTDGEPDGIGIYSTKYRSIRKEFNPVMIVKRKNKGTWLSNTTNPYKDAVINGSRNVVKKFLPIKNPKVGTHINIGGGYSNLYVEEVNTNKKTVLLRARGVKILLPIQE
ncbi:MAG: hypothetical protein KGV44_03380 [Flavobacteriaceae bacterium]|nr:hypothetical protein [Flavobacteriaceae bacterium]